MILKPFIVALIVFLSALAAAGQAKVKPTITPDLSHITSSPAYAEVALRKAELESELESLLSDYTEEFPRVKELKQELGFLRRETLRLSQVKASDAGRLTTALGKLILRKTEIEVGLWKLREAYADEHPEVRRAKKKVEIFEKAIKEILG